MCTSNRQVNWLLLNDIILLACSMYRTLLQKAIQQLTSNPLSKASSVRMICSNLWAFSAAAENCLVLKELLLPSYTLQDTCSCSHDVIWYTYANTTASSWSFFSVGIPKNYSEYVNIMWISTLMFLQIHNSGPIANYVCLSECNSRHTVWTIPVIWLFIASRNSIQPIRYNSISARKAT